MKRPLALISALLGLGLLFLSPAQAGAAEIAPEVERCLAGSDRLSVVLMVDGSASLKEFDPQDERVSGIKAVLAALSRLAEDESSEREVEIEVLLATFFGDTNPKPADTEDGSKWKGLDAESLDDLLDEAEGYYAERNTGRDTDYALALDNARKLLSQRAVERSEQGGEAPPCDLIVFFTDGEFKVKTRDKSELNLPLEVPYAPGLDLSSPRGGEEAMKRGEEFLCRDGGLIDQLNGQGTVLLTVALAKRDMDIDTSLIKEISGQEGGCGSKPSLADYVEGTSGARLLFDFSDSLTGTRPERKKLPPCDGGDCRGGGRDFTTLEGEKGFKLLATTGSSEDGIRFIDPSGEFIEIEAGDSSAFEASGVSFEPLWLSETTIDLVAEFDTESTEWVGDWNVALNTSQRGLRGNLHSLSFQADLKPVQSGGRTLFRGQGNQVSFRLESADGDPLDPDEPSEVLKLLSPRAELSGGNEGSKSLDIEGPDNLELTADVEIPPTETSNEVQIDLTLDFSGAGGRDIDPIRRSFPYRAKLPDSLGYPEIETAALSLPSLTGVGESTGTVEVRGTIGTSGCVWLGAVEVVNAPEGSRPVKVSTEPAAGKEGQCIEVAEGETRQIEVTVAPKGQANGTVDLNLGFGLLSGIESVTEVESSTVGVTLPVAREPNVPARILILVLLTLLGALLPVLLLHLLNRAGARFTAPQGLLYLQESVEFGSGQAALSGDTENAGAMLEAGHSSFNLVKASGVEKQVREHRVGSLKLRTIASFSRSPKVFTLIPGPIGVVESSEGRPVIAGAQMSLKEWGGYRWHEIPLDVPGTWVFEVREVGESLDDDDPFTDSDSAGKRVKGVLTLFTRYGGDPDQGERLLETALRKLGDFDWSRIPTTRLEEQGSTSGEPVQGDGDLIDDGFDPEESASSGDDVLGEGWD